MSIVPFDSEEEVRDKVEAITFLVCPLFLDGS